MVYSEIEANAYSLKLDLINEIDDNNIKNSDWKKMVKRRILNKINKESYIKNRTMKRLRFLQNSSFGEKDYVKRGNLSRNIKNITSETKYDKYRIKLRTANQ